MAGIQNKIIFGDGFKLFPSSAADINQMQETDTISFINYSLGSPEGVVNANPASLCYNPVTGDLYKKGSGTGNTGWVLQGGGAGDVTGTGASVVGHFPAYTDTSGKVIADSGFSDTSFLKSANNLSDLNNAATARTNLGLAIGTNVQAWSAQLDALAALASNGYIVRTAANTVAARTITAGANINVTNGDGVSGNTSIAATGLLIASNNLSDVANASTARTNLGLAIGTNVQAWSAQLDALAALASTGILVQTAANTFAQRTITAGVGMAVTNGNGVSGNPTVAITGGLVLISSQTASNSSSIIFSGLSTYNQYKLYIHKTQPVTNAQALRIEISQNNGSSWVASGYSAGVYYHAYNSTTITNSNSTTIIPISGPCSNGDSFTGELYMGSVNQPDYFTINGLCTWNDTTLGTTASGWMGGRGTTGVNAIRLTFASGNINNGNFTLFGIKTA